VIDGTRAHAHPPRRSERVVIVVGAGAAGTAAALAAAARARRVVMVDGGTGATTLSTGALDLAPWSRASRPPAALTAGARGVLAAMDAHALPEAGARLLTTAGIERPARGHDAALLDVTPFAGRLLGVVRCRRPGWDAAALARSWGEGYEPLDATILRHVDETVLPDADFAARHDDPQRLGWLAERLREALARSERRFAALVLPPCLGVERARGRTLSELVGASCGEAMGLPGGPSGLRFERARDRALSAAAVERVRGRATRVGSAEPGWRIAVESAAGEPLTVDGDAVVLATGGLIGGGLEYAPAEAVFASALPPAPRLPFGTSPPAPVAIGAHGRPIDLPSTLFGPAPESIAWPFVDAALLDRVGVLAGDDGRAAPGLFVAGDLRADGPRTWLDALATGAAAGSTAAESAVSDPTPSWLGAASPSRP